VCRTGDDKVLGANVALSSRVASPPKSVSVSHTGLVAASELGEDCMRVVMVALVLSTLLLIGCSGKSAPLDVPPARTDAAEPQQLAWWSRAAIDAFMRFSAWRGAQSGYIAMFARDGVAVYSDAAGWKDIAAVEPMTVDTPVRIASMTKPVTAVAAMLLVQEGKLSLDDPVANYLPEFAHLQVATSDQPDAAGSFPSAPANTTLLVRHLLMFASGIGPGMNKGNALVDYWDEHGLHKRSGNLAARVAGLAQLPLLEEPGTRWRYGYSADVLARVVEVASGQSISDFMRSRIFQPLGMTHTHYLAAGSADGSVPATVYTQDKAGALVLAPLPHDARDWTPGGSGLVSTASDYMRFALMLWNGGEYQGTRILAQSTVDEMRRLHVPAGVLADEDIKGLGWGLGMAVVADADASLIADRTGDFWWSGYLGTTFFVSPATGLVGVILSQNEPGEFSGRPIEVYILQALAFAGL
jgi:CubicO group peptidase (beta-lactamase class C family)